MRYGVTAIIPIADLESYTKLGHGQVEKDGSVWQIIYITKSFAKLGRHFKNYVQNNGELH